MLPMGNDNKEERAKFCRTSGGHFNYCPAKFGSILFVIISVSTIKKARETGNSVSEPGGGLRAFAHSSVSDESEPPGFAAGWF